MELYGRRKIFTAEENINTENVVEVVNSALSEHFLNAAEETYLYNYRRGRQPILDRVKDIRSDICNKVVVNNAQQVVVFKNGYFLTKPAFYTSMSEDKNIVDKVTAYNDYIRKCGKPQADNKLVDWFHTTGLAALFVKPNAKGSSPASIYALDPRSAFCVYSLQPGNEPVMGINIVQGKNEVLVDVFTKDTYFKLVGAGTLTDYTSSNPLVTSYPFEVVTVKKNVLGEIPIIEYQYNSLRQAAFEPAISIMDEINNVESNRADGVEQQIQQLWVFFNCEFEKNEDGSDITMDQIHKRGFLCLSSNEDLKQDAKAIACTLDQAQTQVTLDNLYEQMLYKCSMPSTTKGGSSTSDTGTAVYLRDGFAMADTDARNEADLFKESNAYFDRVMLKILALKKNFYLDVNDMELLIEHTSMSNMLTRTQAALAMKNLGLSPEIALERSGVSNDPLKDIEKSKPYLEKAWSDDGNNTPTV